jgi:hypothetical protein
MKYLVPITVVILIAPSVLFAQINWTKHTVDATFLSVRSAFAIDLDKDNDVDILVAASTTDSLVWYENDGNENFSKHTIADDFDGVQSVYAADFDGDSDIDVVAAAYFDGITWWENNGANPPDFTARPSLSTSTGSSVYACDLDRDDDVDIVAALGSSVRWWENNGSGSFNEHSIYSSTAITPSSVFAIDINGDTAIDVVASSGWLDTTIFWFENDGDEVFTPHIIVDTLSDVQSVYAIDIEPDGDVDVLAAATSAYDIAWFENDGNENFTHHTIAGEFAGALSVFAIDLNDDEAVDVLGAAGLISSLSYWINVNGNFYHQFGASLDGASSVYALDMDDDGDIDIIGTGTGGGIAWWESDLAFIDVGMVSIDIDSFVPGNTKLLPQATVTNSSTYAVSFEVTCEIDPGDYTSAQTVSDLASGDTTIVIFPDSCLFETGSYTVMVYTRRAGDEDPTNDTLEIIVTVDDTAPVSFSLISPQDSTMLSNPRPQFVWESSSDLVSGLRDYEIYIDDVLEHTGTDTTWTPDYNIQEGWHSWYVITYDNVGNAQQSTEMWYFEIDTQTPNVPTLTSPINGVWLSDTLVLFEWTEVMNLAVTESVNSRRESDKTGRSQVKYIIQVDTLSDFVSPVSTDTVDETSATLLLVENFYYWRVKAYDVAGNQGTYAEPDSFGVDITAPVIESTTVWTDTSFAGPFEIMTKVFDTLSGVDSVLLYYRRDEDPEWVSIVMNPSGEPDWFLESIPPVSNPSTVRYYIETIDRAEPGNVSHDPETAPAEYYWFIATPDPAVEELGDIPTVFSFGLQSNPVRDVAVFNLALPQDAFVTLQIYDVSGRLIDNLVSERKSAGYHKIPWSKDVSSGIFFYHLDSRWESKIGKIVLLK